MNPPHAGPFETAAKEREVVWIELVSVTNWLFAVRRSTAQTSAPTPAPPPTTRPTMAPTATARPWAGWVGRNSVGEDSETCYYRYFNLVINKTLTRPALQRRTWSQARDFCAAQAKDMTPGGAFTPHLVSIYDEAENQFVSDLVTVEYRDLPNRPVWIGAHDTTHEHDFHWPNGDAVQYRNFPLGVSFANLCARFIATRLVATPASQGCINLDNRR